VTVRAGQTWCYDSDEGEEPGSLYLILAVEPDPVATFDEDVTLLNLETGEVHDLYPASHFRRDGSFWRREA
jgi:hypothetical protein